MEIGQCGARNGSGFQGRPDGEYHGDKAGSASDEIGDWFCKEDSGGSKTCDFRKK